jgi:hypothetical protein
MSCVKAFGVHILKRKWHNDISRDTISSSSIEHSIKYNLVLFKLKKKNNKYFIYATINPNYDYNLNFKIAECYLSKIYIYMIKEITKNLFKKYKHQVYWVLLDIICSYLDIGNISFYEKIYKSLINQMFHKKLID